MSSSNILLLNQCGLVVGFVGAILLALSAKVGVLSKDGSIIFSGLDPMAPAETNAKRVQSSHWRHRFLTPVGWLLLASSFALQFAATFPPS